MQNKYKHHDAIQSITRQDIKDDTLCELERSPEMNAIDRTQLPVKATRCCVCGMRFETNVYHRRLCVRHYTSYERHNDPIAVDIREFPTLIPKSYVEGCDRFMKLERDKQTRKNKTK